MDSPSRPVDVIQLGHIQASIWEERTPDGSRHWVSVRRQSDETPNEHKGSDRFPGEDLPTLARALGLASARISYLLHEEGETA